MYDMPAAQVILPEHADLNFLLIDDARSLELVGEVLRWAMKLERP